jgi:SAM-dependent methyltransferase
MDPTTRFSSRVADYVRSRPGYPPAVIEVLHSECGLDSRSVVADVGAGTGILTALLLAHAGHVFAVEPNREMRNACEARLAAHLGFRSVDGRAEATTLPDESVDLVTTGQAFHWFEPKATRTEWSRILRPGGWVAIVWNDRQTHTTPFLAAYEDLLRRFGTDYAQVNHTRIDRGALEAFFGGPFSSHTFANEQAVNFDGLVGRLLSSSYAPGAGHPDHEEMLAHLAGIFAAHQREGLVTIDYTTRLYVGRVRNLESGI